MKASETNLFKFLEGNKQFIIPIYQRTYSWTREQCEQLWNDIVRAATHAEVTAHFVGSIVYIQQGLYQAADVSQMLVIDGQQRLTTLTLLLAALVREGSHEGINAKKIVNSYLTNPDEEGEKTYKLLLTQSDRLTLIAKIAGHDQPKEASPRIVENYQFFADRIRTSDLDPQIIYAGLGKLVLVDIALDRDHDNPQLIFESLNSTGMDLSQADLIRNYILMRLEPDHQRKLYAQHWFPMEQIFGPAHYSSHFDRFMRDYLTIKMRTIPKSEHIYKVFKTYREETMKEVQIDAILADIHDFAKLFVKLAFNDEKENKESDAAIRDALADINDIEVNVAYPVLLELYHDYDQDSLNQEEFIALIRLIESYVFRRAICEIPTASLNKTFATFMRDVDKSNYRVSVESLFTQLSSYKRFPRDDEFQRALTTKDLYHFQRRAYYLRKFENHGRKEYVPTQSYTIEHIMPQNPNLSGAWQQELGPDWQAVQARNLHTIGNLTLTGYNSELSDRSFAEKQSMAGGFKQSPLHLNASLAQVTTWNEAAILHRAAELAHRSVAIWGIPAVAPALASTQHGPGEKYGLDHYATLTNNPLVRELFLTVRRNIMNLDANIQEVLYKNAISFEIPDQFAWVQPRQTQVSISFWANPLHIDDPEGKLYMGTINAQSGQTWLTFKLKSQDQLSYALYVIEQSLILRRDSVDDEFVSVAADTFDTERE